MDFLALLGGILADFGPANAGAPSQRPTGIMACPRGGALSDLRAPAGITGRLRLNSAWEIDAGQLAVPSLFSSISSLAASGQHLRCAEVLCNCESAHGFWCSGGVGRGEHPEELSGRMCMRAGRCAAGKAEIQVHFLTG